MPLSPLAKYSVRKLVRQNLNDLSKIFGTDASYQILNVDLDKIINHIYLDDAEISIKVNELEALTKIYADLEKNGSDEADFSEIKRRIFNILGFREHRCFPSQLPIIVQETMTSMFYFYYENEVRKGIRYQGELYGAVYKFDVTNRLETYQIAWAFSEQNIPLVVTVSGQGHTLWINLRSLAYSVLLHQDMMLLKLVLPLHSALRKCKYAIFRQGRGRIKG
ncbi:hypothetical protein [Myxacorys almedinensis]|uniref:Uncharacterized protein n=1 Tax=Myxacorys almedinensis A TaxID=2690445 RepID=A0A8J8CLX9_9CYAN|nr:hypothetical protein [Myxacorys almedinensis]NDJ16607.1 hypothetical protein [Myxacorys almedinensis A]